MGDSPRVAVLRPDDGRLEATAEALRAMGAEPVADAMLTVDPTGASPRPDADIVVFTSTTGARLAAETGWVSGEAAVVAIGPSTADALREHGYDVDTVPDEYSSSGLVSALAETVPGRKVEIARSDHGSATLIEGLADAGGYVHETVLYRLDRPPGAGESAELAAMGDLDAILFTSSLTVEHFLEAAEDRGCRAATLKGLNDGTIVGAIGDPTRETAAAHGIGVDVTPAEANVEALAGSVLNCVRAD